MENTRPQPCGQAHVQDAFHLEAVRDDAGRKALFARMCREGLTGCAMYAWPHPREDDWLHLVSAPGRLLEESGYGNHPAVLRFFSRLADSLLEDSLPGSEGGGSLPPLEERMYAGWSSQRS